MVNVNEFESYEWCRCFTWSLEFEDNGWHVCLLICVRRRGYDNNGVGMYRINCDYLML